MWTHVFVILGSHLGAELLGPIGTHVQHVEDCQTAFRIGHTSHPVSKA